MKNHKILSFFLILVVLLNLVYFGIKIFTDYENFISNKIESFLEEKLDSDVSIKKLNVNERELSLQSINIDSEDFSIEIKSLNAKYNVVRLLFSKTKIKKMNIISPEIAYAFEPKNNSSKKKINIKKEITKVLKIIENISEEINIVGLDFDFSYKSELISFDKNFENIDIYYEESNKIKISSNDKVEDLNAIIKIKKNKIKKASWNVKNFSLEGNSVEKINFDDFSLDLEGKFNNNKFDYLFALKDVNASRGEFNVNFDSLAIKGKNQNIEFDFTDLVFNEANINFNGKLKNLLSEKPEIAGEISTSNLKNSVYYRLLIGSSKINGKINGNLFRPKISFDIKSPKIGYGDYVGKNISGKGTFFGSDLKINFSNIDFRGNKLHGKGSIIDYDYSKVTLFSDDFTWNQDSLFLANGEVEADFYSNFHNIKAKAKVKKGKFSVKNSQLKNISAEIKQENWKTSLIAENQDLNLDLTHDFKKNNTDGFIKFKNFNLNDLFKNTNMELPTLSGTANFKKNERNIISDLYLRAYNEKYGSFDGIYKSNIVFDFVHKKSFIKLETFDGIYNFTPYKLRLIAGGSLDKIKSYQMIINDDIRGKFTLSRKPKFDFDLLMNGKDVQINNYLAYFSENSIQNDISGLASFKVNYNDNRKISGFLNVKDLKYKEFRDFNSELIFSGDLNEIDIEKFSLIKKNREFLKANGSYSVLKNKFDIHSDIDSLNLNYFYDEVNYYGNVSGSINLSNIDDSTSIDAKFYGKDLSFSDLMVKDFMVDIEQKNNDFHVKDLKFDTNFFNLNANGKIGYNLYENKSYKSDEKINVNFSGDLLKFLTQKESIFKNGKSNANISLDISTNDDGITIDNGSIDINKGSVFVENQKFPLENIKLQAEFQDNLFNVNEFKFNVDEGSVQIKNEILNDDNDFILGNLNLGQFFLKTRDKISANIPFYTLKNSTSRAEIKGRDSDFAHIKGPFEDIRITLNVLAYNTSAIYPKNTSNVMNLLTSGISINKKKIEKDSENHRKKIPIYLDLKVILKEDVYYSTYPAKFKMEENSFLHLIYDNGDWSLPEASFTSNSGSLELFDNTFEVEKVEVLINKYDEQPLIYGNLKKILADGTEVYLQLYREKNAVGNLIGDLKFKLSSSDTDDETITDIIAKLKYNKDYSELTQEEKNNMVQDEAMQLAGIGINSRFVRPILVPFENFVRKFLKLDTFNLRLVLISNLIENYTENLFYENEAEIENSENYESNSSLLLNNLSISAGKYLFKSFYLGYDAIFEKNENTISQNNIELKQTLNLRFALPYKIKFTYKYKIEENNKRSQEIFFKKSFRF